MVRRPPRSTRPYPPFPYTTLYRSTRLHRRVRLRQTAIRPDPALQPYVVQQRDHQQGQRGGDQDAEDQRHRQALEDRIVDDRSEEHKSELQSLMRISYAVFCLTKKPKLELVITRTNARTE